jgi:DNA-binding LacI/PurR family transcriptional regulator
MAKITAKDVARVAGVDPSAVSRVLNQATENHRYSSETIELIKRAADELGYQPSIAARALRTGRSMLIGMVVPDIGNPFFAAIASHVENLAWQAGYRVVVCSTTEDAGRQTSQINDLISRGVDGLIVSPAMGGIIPVTPPAIAIDRPAEADGISCVCLDNRKAGYLLGEHLRQQGYRSIGIVLQEFQLDPTLRERLDGFIEGLGDADIAWQLEIPFSSEMVDIARVATGEKLNNVRWPDAIVGLTNWCTLGALEAMAEHHIEWGSQVGLGGVDDFAGAGLMKPGITVVAQPVKQLANEAFVQLLKIMTSPDENENLKTQVQLLEPVLIIRDSLPKK